MKDKSELYILWTNDNPVTAEKMVFMYSVNSIKHGWWEAVTVIVWGATAPLVAENMDIQREVKDALKKGVQIIACKACADQLGIAESLECLGIEVDYTGELLTQIIKSEKNLLTI